METKKILITGSSGFIGAALCKKLLSNKKITIIGIDNMNDYYDVSLKKYRLEELEQSRNFIFIKGDIANKELIEKTFKKYNPEIVINLAAQAGVRYSITNPDTYIKSNIIGFYNILEACRNNKPKYLIFASSSSVYGNSKTPYKEEDKTETPESLYAATKKSNELLAYSYSNLYNIKTTGLRFFTVYGPKGRPDMAYFSFTNKLLNNETIKIFNHGKCKRDFTYIDDIINGIEKIINKPHKELYKIYNIGNNNPVNLLDFIKILEKELKNANLIPKDYKIKQELLPMQKGDVKDTYADTTALEKDYNYKPNTKLEKGLKEFVDWYKEYYK